MGIKMQIIYDKDADALYIEIRKGKFASNKKIDSDTVVDLDERGKLLGIELLSASKRIPLKELKNISVKASA